MDYSQSGITDVSEQEIFPHAQLTLCIISFKYLKLRVATKDCFQYQLIGQLTSWLTAGDIFKWLVLSGQLSEPQMYSTYKYRGLKKKKKKHQYIFGTST